MANKHSLVSLAITVTSDFQRHELLNHFVFVTILMQGHFLGNFFFSKTFSSISSLQNYLGFPVTPRPAREIISRKASQTPALSRVRRRGTPALSKTGRGLLSRLYIKNDHTCSGFVLSREEGTPALSGAYTLPFTWAGSGGISRPSQRGQHQLPRLGSMERPAQS